MHPTMRWFGPNDPVSLSDIRQAGCAGVVTALHQVPVGDVWSAEAIRERKALVHSAGMTWTVVESLPVSDDIKRQRGEWQQHIANYKGSLHNLAAEGIKVVTYNFMPVFDWLRTDTAFELPGGGRALYFNRAAFIAFDLFLLQRPGAAAGYTAAEINQAELVFTAMSPDERRQLFHNCMLGLPGSDEAFTPEKVFAELDKYAAIDAGQLQAHLFHFLREIIPVAEACGLQMAIHPDDPPYSILGLPRVVSTEQDATAIINCMPSPANGLCFCTGSFGARADNDIVGMLQRLGDHVHFLHLRNTKRDADGNFFEAAHLEGDTDIVAVVNEVLAIQQRRNCSLPMRPDHGHQLLDDLKKAVYPGYSAIGRLKGLAELRGVEYALANTQYNKKLAI